MIASLVKGRGFRGCVSYLFNGRKGEEKEHERGNMVFSNMAGNTPKELSWEFRQIAALRPQLNKSVFHASLSLAPEDRTLSDFEWAEITQRLMNGLGFSECPIVAYRHKPDTDGCNHDHIHIVASRVDTKGKPVSDKNDFRRTENILRSIEVDFGLRVLNETKEINKTEKAIMNEQQKTFIENRLESATVEAAGIINPVEEIFAVECGEKNLTDKKRRNLKRRLLEEAYSKMLSESLLDCVRYVERRPNELRIHTKDNGLLIDRGDNISANGMNHKQASERLMMICLAKGWKNIVVKGNDDFLRECMGEAIRKGLIVCPIDEHQTAIWNETLKNHEVENGDKNKLTGAGIKESDFLGGSGIKNRLQEMRKTSDVPYFRNPRFPR